MTYIDYKIAINIYVLFIVSKKKDFNLTSGITMDVALGGDGGSKFYKKNILSGISITYIVYKIAINIYVIFIVSKKKDSNLTSGETLGGH